MSNYTIKEMAERLLVIRSACDPTKNQFLWDRLTKFAEELKEIGLEWRPVSEVPADGMPIIFRQTNEHYVVFRADMDLASEPYRMQGEPKLEWRPYSRKGAANPNLRGS